MARKSRKNIETTAVQMAKTMYNVGAYIRLSSIDRKQKGDSIETQQAIINSFINEHSDMELREVYIDNGLSGQTFERPAFQQMLADMESGKINCCAVKDLSRLGRNAIDSGYYVEKYFPTNNIRFGAITDNYDSADGTSGGIMLSLKNMINESYALEVGRKVRAVYQMNIKNGAYVGKKPPYGYLVNPQNFHKLVVDEYAGKIVRKIFDMFSKGQGAKTILEWLTTNNILPPMRYFHSIGVASEKEAKGHWSIGIIYSILKNRIYCGDMAQGKTKMTKQGQKALPKSGWVITENTHEALIRRELFSQVQAMFTKYNKPAKNQYSEQKTDNIFLRKVFCGHCGYTMFRSRTGETNYRFTCATKGVRGESKCVIMSINEKILKEKLLEIISELDFETTTNDNTNNCDLTSVKTEIINAQNFLKSLYESLILGDITDSEYKEMKSGYETKIADLIAREKQLREHNYNCVQTESALSKAHQDVKGIKHVSDLNAEVIERLIEKIYVYENERITVKFRFMEEVKAHE
jgi:DNA invertase Pin-like site-specific DNA recombinase